MALPHAANDQFTPAHFQNILRWVNHKRVSQVADKRQLHRRTALETTANENYEDGKNLPQGHFSTLHQEQWKTEEATGFLTPSQGSSNKLQEILWEGLTFSELVHAQCSWRTLLLKAVGTVSVTKHACTVSLRRSGEASPALTGRKFLSSTTGLLSYIPKLPHTNKLEYLIQRFISGSVQQCLDKDVTLNFPVALLRSVQLLPCVALHMDFRCFGLKLWLQNFGSSFLF